MTIFLWLVMSVIVWAAEPPMDDRLRVAYHIEKHNDSAFIFDTLTAKHMILTIVVPQGVKPGDTLAVYHLYPYAISRANFLLQRKLKQLEGDLIQLEKKAKR